MLAALVNMYVSVGRVNLDQTMLKRIEEAAEGRRVSPPPLGIDPVALGAPPPEALSSPALIRWTCRRRRKRSRACLRRMRPPGSGP